MSDLTTQIAVAISQHRRVRQQGHPAAVVGADPDAVDFELDLYWAAYGGADPADLLRRHAERIPLLHPKDISPHGEGGQRRDAPAGSGTLDWDAIIDARGDEDRWYIVEQDT